MSYFKDELDNELPDFALSVYDDGEGDIEIHAHLPTEPPSISKHASLPTLYGLAILILDRQGTINNIIDQILAEGPINEVEAQNRIANLLEQEHNDLAS